MLEVLGDLLNLCTKGLTVVAFLIRALLEGWLAELRHFNVNVHLL